MFEPHGFTDGIRMLPGSRVNVEVQLNRISNPTLDEFTSRLRFPAGVPDHVVFLLQPSDNLPSNEFIEQLNARLRGKANVFGDAKEQPMATFSFGYSYFDRQVCTNTSVAMTLSGFGRNSLATFSTLTNMIARHVSGDRSGARLHVHLFINVFEMAAHGLDADAKAVGDFFVRIALG